MEHWRAMWARAWREATESIGLGTRGRVIGFLVIQVLIALAILLFLPSQSLAVRAVTAGAQFLALPILAGVHWILLPPALAKEAAQRSASEATIGSIAALMHEGAQAQDAFVGTGNTQDIRTFRVDWIHRVARMLRETTGDAFEAEFRSAKATSIREFDGRSNRGVACWNDIEAKKSVLSRIIAHLRGKL